MEIKKIIVSVDFGNTTNKLAEFALYIRTQFSAEIGFCHVAEHLSPGYLMLDSHSLGNLEKKMGTNAEERLDSKQRAGKHWVDTSLHQADRPHQIEQEVCL